MSFLAVLHLIAMPPRPALDIAFCFVLRLASYLCQPFKSFFSPLKNTYKLKVYRTTVKKTGNSQRKLTTSLSLRYLGFLGKVSVTVLQPRSLVKTLLLVTGHRICSDFARPQAGGLSDFFVVVVVV